MKKKWKEAAKRRQNSAFGVALNREVLAELDYNLHPKVLRGWVELYRHAPGRAFTFPADEIPPAIRWLVDNRYLRAWIRENKLVVKGVRPKACATVDNFKELKAL